MQCNGDIKKNDSSGFGWQWLFHHLIITHPSLSRSGRGGFMGGSWRRPLRLFDNCTSLSLLHNKIGLFMVFAWNIPCRRCRFADSWLQGNQLTSLGKVLSVFFLWSIAASVSDVRSHYQEFTKLDSKFLISGPFSLQHLENLEEV